MSDRAKKVKKSSKDEDGGKPSAENDDAGGSKTRKRSVIKKARELTIHLHKLHGDSVSVNATEELSYVELEKSVAKQFQDKLKQSKGERWAIFVVSTETKGKHQCFRVDVCVPSCRSC
jgi:hypothetical protein